MTLLVHVDADVGAPIPSELLIEAARATLAHQGQQDAELTILVTGDETVRRLNLQFRSIDQPTDVLSFPHGEPNPESGLLYLGDLVISLPEAQRQAREAGHRIEDELTLLTVHGVLHLLQHDHARPAEKKRMWTAQAEILAQLGSEITEPPS